MTLPNISVDVPCEKTEKEPCTKETLHSWVLGEGATEVVSAKIVLKVEENKQQDCCGECC